MLKLSLRTVFEQLLVIAIGVAVLWKGGKGLEVTWLLPLLALVGAMVLWLNTKKNAVPPAAWPASLVAGLFIIWTVVSFLLSETRNYGLDEVIRDVSLALIWLQLLRLAKAPREALAIRIVDVLVYAVLLAGLIGLVIYMFQPVGRFVGTFFDPRYHTDFWPNAWAELVLLAWPLLACKAWLTEGRARAIWSVLCGCIVGSMLLSYSRGGWLAGLGQLALLAGIVYWLTPKKRREVMIRPTLITAGLVAAIAVATFFLGNGLRSLSYPVQNLGAKVTFTADEGTSSIDERVDFWAQSWQLAAERPFFGHGPYSFRFLQPRLQQDVYATSDHAHNAWLKLAMERGWPSAVLWSLMILLSLVAAGRRLGTSRELDWSVFAAIGIAGVLAHVLIDYNLQFVGIALPFWLLLGLLGAPMTPKKAPRRLGTAQNALELIIVLLLTCLAVREASYLVTSSLGRKAEARADFVTAQRWYEASAGSWFTRDLRLGQAAIALRQDQVPAARVAIAAYLAENSQDARAYSLRAAIEEKAGNRQAAAADLAQAFAWSKLNDLEVLRRWLSLAQFDASLPPLPTKDIQAVFRAYGTALERNSHFILLGDSVEDYSTICWMEETHNEYGLRPLCRQSLSAIMAQSVTVRSGLDARKRGRLW